jgi:anti-anti-sigma factor
MPGAAAEPVLKLEIQKYSESVAPGGCAMVTCHGRLVAGQTHLLLETVTPLLQENKRVILELSDLQHTDSMGLGALVKLYVTSRSTGSSLELKHLNQQIRNLLGMTNLLEILTVIGDRNVRLM